MQRTDFSEFVRTTQDEEILRRLLDTHTSVVTALNAYRYKGGKEQEQEEEQEEEVAAAAAGSPGADVQAPIKVADVQAPIKDADVQAPIKDADMQPHD